jgi:FMN reductase
MSEIVVLSGHPRPGSRTSRLAEAVGATLAAELGGPAPRVIDLASFGPRLLTPGAEDVGAAAAAVRAAGVLVVATPTYKATYTGVLKVLFDLLPADGLAGVVAAPVVTAGSAEHAANNELRLRELLLELGARVAPALTVLEEQLAQLDGAVDRYAATVAEFLGAPAV